MGWLRSSTHKPPHTVQSSLPCRPFTLMYSLFLPSVRLCSDRFNTVRAGTAVRTPRQQLQPSRAPQTLQPQQDRGRTFSTAGAPQSNTRHTQLRSQITLTLVVFGGAENESTGLSQIIHTDEATWGTIRERKGQDEPTFNVQKTTVSVCRSQTLTTINHASKNKRDHRQISTRRYH